MKTRILFFLVLAMPFFSWSQSNRKDITGYLKQSKVLQQLSEKDISEWIITDQHYSKISGLEHIYLQQQYLGIDIMGATMSMHLNKTGDLLKINNQFIPLEDKILSSKVAFNAQQAVVSAAKQLGNNTSQTSFPSKSSNAERTKHQFDGRDISTEIIPVKLIYLLGSDGILHLAWNLIIHQDDTNVWDISLDAITGETLKKTNKVIICEMGNNSPPIANSHQHLSTVSTPHSFEEGLKKNASLIGGYRVFPLPLISPDDGGRSLINDPDDPTASPFGWHDNNGSAGSEFTNTQGNNVNAYDTHNGFSPDGGSSLIFDFPLDLEENFQDYEAPGLTNLFYVCNAAHDIMYHYGFDEASGNFQDNNYGNGGVAGDYVIALGQSLFRIPGAPEPCHASFLPQVEGVRPSLRMGVCEGNDGSYNNTTIIHEYTHGLTTRLIGGSSTTSCLDNQEQMGEGWSDWYALMLTLKPGDLHSDLRNYGQWYYDDSDGIRTYPYTTDMTINPSVYGNLEETDDDSPNVRAHAVGEIWCSMLWEMTWILIDVYGFDSNIYSGTGGNNIALQLVTEGLKLAPCNPGFVDARDAILDADMALNNGINQCLIWEAFAKRGLGLSADQADADDVNDGTEAYDVPCSGCQNNFDITGGSISPRHYQVSNSISAKGVISASDQTIFQAGDFVNLHTSFCAEAGSNFCARIEDCIDGDGGGYFYNGKYDNNQETSNLPSKPLLQISNHPNPFSRQTTFDFQLPKSTQVQLSIYDNSGRLVDLLIDQKQLEEGQHFLNYDAQKLLPGIYLYKLTTEQGTLTQKMIIN